MAGKERASEWERRRREREIKKKNPTSSIPLLHSILFSFRFLLPSFSTSLLWVRWFHFAVWGSSKQSLTCWNRESSTHNNLIYTGVCSPLFRNEIYYIGSSESQASLLFLFPLTCLPTHSIVFFILPQMAILSAVLSLLLLSEL